MTNERTSTFTAKDGAVLTDEVGVITGEVTLRTQVDDQGGVVQKVQYKDADEWYGLTGAPGHVTEGQDVNAIHTQTVTQLAQG